DLSELDYIEADGDELRIGALTRHRALLESDLLAERFPIFRDAEHVIADPIVRNRGTIGGALCQADPSEDLSAVCAATHAQIVDAGVGLAAVGAGGFRAGAAEEALRGQEPSEDLFAQAAAAAADGCSPTADQRGSVEYKRHLAGELTKRALRRAVERAKEAV